MPGESELREILRRDGSAPAEIDLAAVLRRSRARRRPRLVAGAALGAFALAGVLVPVGIATIGTPPPSALTSAAGDADSGPEDTGELAEAAPADRLDLCGGVLADSEPAANGLVLEVPPMDLVSERDRIAVLVTLRNTGSQWVRGTVAGGPVLTLSRSGVVVAQAAEPSAPAFPIGLAPGGTLDFVVDLEFRACGVADDADGVGAEPPPAASGDYRVSAALDFRDEAGSAPLLVTGPASPVVLR